MARLAVSENDELAALEIEIDDTDSDKEPLEFSIVAAARHIGDQD